MLEPLKLLRRNVQFSIEAKESFVSQDDQMAVFERAVLEVIARYKAGGRLYIAGNGGSAADAQHLAAEFVSKLARDRDPLPAEALTVDTSILTAIGNDYGYDQVFSRQIYAKLGKSDIFLGITTSGNSVNILNALDACRELGVPSIVFSGRDGGHARNKATYCVVVPGDMTSTIQELHIVLAHTLCECVEAAVFGE
jgi:D-sedoheptulose 7-phosphate isomerase